MGELHRKRWAGWCALLCAVCIVFTMLGGALEAYAAGTGKISGSKASAEKGENVTVSFSVSDNPGLWGLKGSVSYDSAVLTLKSVSAGSVFSESEITMGEDLKQNPFAFLATGSTIADKTKNGTLLKLTFTVSKDAELKDYSVKLNITQAINANGDDVSVTVSSAKITVASCLHRNTYLKDAVKATEEAEGYSGDSYCEKCGVLVKKGKTLPKVVNTCKHENQVRTVVTEADCVTVGKIKITCGDCDKELAEETVPAMGHVEDAPVQWKAATTTEEGYTGDIYCNYCGELLQVGKAIPKIPILVFAMTAQTEDTYLRNSGTGLVFVSAAQLDTFVRVEVDGSVLDAQSYQLESGSTKVTLKPEYLEKLADGKHTVTIVSDAGTASAQFYVAVPQEPQEEPEEETGPIPYKVLLIITLIAVLVAVGCVAFTVIMGVRRNRRGRYSRYGAK